MARSVGIDVAACDMTIVVDAEWLDFLGIRNIDHGELMGVRKICQIGKSRGDRARGVHQAVIAHDLPQVIDFVGLGRFGIWKIDGGESLRLAHSIV